MGLSFSSVCARMSAPHCSHVLLLLLLVTATSKKITCRAHPVGLGLAMSFGFQMSSERLRISCKMICFFVWHWPARPPAECISLALAGAVSCKMHQFSGLAGAASCGMH